MLFKDANEPLLSLEDDESVNNDRETEFRISNKNLYIACSGILNGSLGMGIVLGMSSPMIPAMQADHSSTALDLTESQYTWFGSLATIGAMLGGFAGGFCFQILGRKLTAMLCAVPFIAGMMLMSYAMNFPTLIAGRVISGFAAGVASLVVPTYISEVSTTKLRGLLVSGHQFYVTIGVLLAYGIGIVTPWRLFAILCGIPAVFLAFCTAMAPESPRYLVSKRKTAEAKQALRKLRGDEADIETELELLEESIGSALTTSSWMDLIRDSTVRTPLILSLVVMFFQQAGGVNAIMFYSQTIFEEAGFVDPTSITIALILVASIQVIFTGISCFIMDKAGRKVLLVISGSLMCISSGTFGLYFQLTRGNSNETVTFGSVQQFIFVADDSSSNDLSWLALLSLCVYMSAFAIGYGPIPWLILSEIIPVRARSKASGLSTAFNWTLAFIVTKEFNDMEEVFTIQGTFWVFSGVCLLGVIFTICILPETKGKTLEEIALYFENRSLFGGSRD